MLGYTVLRDYLVVLAHDSNNGVNPDKIYKVLISSLKTAGDLTIDNTYYWTAGTHYLVYEEDLGFNLSYPIRVVGNYENTDVQKIYWVDGLNTLKHLNIVYNADYNDLSSLDKQLLEILPNHTYGSYTITEGSGGNLKSGRIQYSYQLYSISGTETMFAPPSNLYNVTTYNSIDGEDFAGNDKETIVNKSLTVTITLASGIENTFDRIRLVALEYEFYGDIPTVRIVAEQNLSSNVVTFTDIGNTIGELILEEFQLVKNDFIPKTIESKNNYLFAGNITEEYFDIDDLVYELDPTDTFFDSRAYRWRYVDAAGVGSGSQILTDATDPHAITDPPGYGSNSFDTTPTLMYALINDTSWSITVKIGAREHATGLARTFTGVSSVNGTAIIIRFHKVAAGTWSSLILTTFGGFYWAVCDATHDWLTIYGTGYGGNKPSDINPSPDWFDKDAVTTLSYTYTYTYTTGGAGQYECVVNRGNIGNSPELVIDDGLGGGPNYSIVPEDHDCTNTFNNIVNDTDVNRLHVYKYKYGGADPPVIANLGGTGRCISYAFTTTTIPAGYRDSNGTDDFVYITNVSSAYPGYSSQSNVYSYTGYSRDEVCRFGIVFYDLKGRPCYPKWIADIRMPDMSEELDPGVTYSDLYQLCVADGVSPTLYLNVKALGINFTINWDNIETDYPGLLALLSGFQIVRMPRTSNDCTILAQGIIVPTHLPTTPAGSIKNTNYSSYNITSARDYQIGGATTIVTTITGTDSTIDKTLVELLSPEIAINKEIVLDRTNDFFEVCGYIDNISTVAAVLTAQKSYAVTAMTVMPLNPTPALITDWRKSIVDGFISTPEAKSPPSHVVDTTAYTARGYDDTLTATNPEMTYKGTSFVAKISAAFANVTSGGIAGEEKAMYGRYRRYRGYAIYGGATYTERSYNQYIKAGEFTVVALAGTTTVSIYGGDTYICPFGFAKLFMDIQAEYLTYTGQSIVTFPVESRINLNYRIDKFNKYVTAIQDYNYRLAELESIGVSQYPNYYPNSVGSLYRYNSAYSSENISKSYLSKPFDFRSVESKDTFVTNSERKFNGEYSDSWLKFKYNNYLELEGEYGAITRLINNQDKLMCFQPRGISVLSVLERELVETNNTTTLAVGTGGILSRYDYLTKDSGTSLYDAIVPTDIGIYYYDEKNKRINRISDALEAISDTKGMKSYFYPKDITTMIGAYDKENREVLFSPLSTYPTSVFSGYKNAFTGFYTFNALLTYISKYITFDKYLLSSLDANRFYLHNVGEYNEYYGVHQTSSLTLIANPAKTNVVSFHIIEWLTDLTTSGVDELALTFDNVQITNTHQDTGVIALNGNIDLKRRFRKWRLNIFRNLSDSKRIRDSWVKVIFTWGQNLSHHKLIIHPVSFSFLPTKIR
jgi:hypothetical protein